MSKTEKIQILTENAQKYIELLNETLNELNKELQNEKE